VAEKKTGTVVYVAQVTDTFDIGGNGRQGVPGLEDVPNTVKPVRLVKGQPVDLDENQAAVLLDSGAVREGVE
jgi:hypothetical protein